MSIDIKDQPNTCLVRFDDLFQLFDSDTGNKLNIKLFFNNSHSNSTTSIKAASMKSLSCLTTAIMKDGLYKFALSLDINNIDLEIFDSVSCHEWENLQLQYLRICNDYIKPWEFLDASKLLILWFRESLQNYQIKRIIYRSHPHLYIDYCFYLAAKTISQSLRIFCIEPLRGISKDYCPRKPVQFEYCQVYDLVTNKRLKISTSDLYHNQGREKTFQSICDHITQFSHSSNEADIKESRKTRYIRDKEAIMLKDRSHDRYFIHHQQILDSCNFLSSLKRTYNSYSTEFLPLHSFILLALSKQPEASTNPRARHEWSQLLVAKKLALIAKSLGKILLIKDHPSIFKWSLVNNNHFLNSQSFPRSKVFYDSLISLPNTSLLRLNINLDFVVANPKCFAVYTCEGSTGVAALSSNKYIIHSGDPWYATYPKSCSLKSAQDFLSASQTSIGTVSNSEYSWIRLLADEYIIRLYCGQQPIDSSKHNQASSLQSLIRLLPR